MTDRRPHDGLRGGRPTRLETIREHRYEAVENGHPETIVRRHGDGSLLATDANPGPDEPIRPRLIAVDEAGAVEWERSLRVDVPARTTGLARTSDGGYLLVGRNHESEQRRHTGWVVSLDADGRPQWDRLVEGYDTYGAVETTAGEYLLYGAVAGDDGGPWLRALVAVRALLRRLRRQHR